MVPSSTRATSSAIILGTMHDSVTAMPSAFRYAERSLSITLLIAFARSSPPMVTALSKNSVISRSPVSAVASYDDRP